MNVMLNNLNRIAEISEGANAVTYAIYKDFIGTPLQYLRMGCYEV